MKHHILYPTISEIPGNSSGGVKWIGMHPLEMIDRIKSMTKHSTHARSVAKSIDAVSMKSATTPPPLSNTDARCESLVLSILNERDVLSSVKEKNDLFQTIMNDWLTHNWTNPFPDTTALNVLATQLIQAQCIVVKDQDAQVLVGKSVEERQRYMMKTTIKKIETYLANTRMRKWRKCIEDAFDLRRPANLLLEDSLRLCLGKALRPVEGWNPDKLTSRARYSLPLKAWKVTKKVVKKRSVKDAAAATAGTEHVTPKRQRVASPKELSAGDGLIALAKGIRVMTTCERKTSPADVVVRVGGMGLSPFDIDTSPGLEDDARGKMKEGTFFNSF
mmetsp:Transcript_10658/g.17596  ORF Transcript_10658/g.17596 Transcript_10658/m.17596 type:complete len:332 (+) Transcript_10658:58-1053(+)